MGRTIPGVAPISHGRVRLWRRERSVVVRDLFRTIQIGSDYQVRQLVTGMAPILLLYFLYTVIRFLVKDHGPVEGIRNGYNVLHLEERLGLDWEVSLQEVMLPHEWLVKAANWYYVIGFLPVILACAALAAVLDFQTFLWWRKRFALTMILALIGFALFPLAPPRMLPGMVDTLMVYGPQYYGDSQGSSFSMPMGACRRW